MKSIRISNSEALNKYIRNIGAMNKRTASSIITDVRGEYTKTRTDRTVFLTEEITKQLVSWLNYKHRTRRVCYKNKPVKQLQRLELQEGGY
jgi:hypothetical protein